MGIPAAERILGVHANAQEFSQYLGWAQCHQRGWGCWRGTRRSGTSREYESGVGVHLKVVAEYFLKPGTGRLQNRVIGWGHRAACSPSKAARQRCLSRGACGERTDVKCLHHGPRCRRECRTNIAWLDPQCYWISLQANGVVSSNSVWQSLRGQQAAVAWRGLCLLLRSGLSRVRFTLLLGGPAEEAGQPLNEHRSPGLGLDLGRPSRL